MGKVFRILFLMPVMLTVCAGMTLAQTVTGERVLPADHTAGQRVQYTISINVDEADVPNGLTVVETLPAGWSNPTAVPAISVEDGQTIKWLFTKFAGDVKDQTITIWADSPVCGASMFSGELKYNDPANNLQNTAAPVAGDTLISGPSDPDCRRVVISPGKIDFGCVPVGQSRSGNITISNAGKTGINRDLVPAGPIGSSQFTVVRDDCPQVLNTDQPCTIELAFSPDPQLDENLQTIGEGVKTTNLPVAFFDVAPLTITLRGSGIAKDDTDGDCVVDEDEDVDNSPSKASPNSSTGNGRITIDATDASNPLITLTNVQSMDDDDPFLSSAGRPGYDQYQCKYGLVTFMVNLGPGDTTAVVKITYPETLPEGSEYYKVDDNGWHIFGGASINGNTVTLTLTDGGGGDADGTVNGVIVDPGGVVTPVPPAAAPSDGPVAAGEGDKGGGGGCFIATAAYGSYLSDEVTVLRKFRDKFLLTNPPGKWFVMNIYYRWSPPMAGYIARHESLRAATRTALTPVVYSIKYPYLPAGVLLAGGLVLLRRRK
ncbi:MAG: hypothetical protein HZA16_03975 [Nitrospirae bacterium]|nr:hypothetical protein [Nitrospirota bacterium]